MRFKSTFEKFFLLTFATELICNLAMRVISLSSWDKINSYSASRDNWCTVAGNGGCRVGEVRAGTTSPMSDHKGFKLQ